MALDIIDSHSAGAGAVNEDRAGAAGRLAWVIDGATDVVPAPLTGAPSDAAWIAAVLDRALLALAPGWTGALDGLVPALTASAAAAFSAEARRAPAGRHEHPSAAAVIVRLDGTRLDWLQIADCTALACCDAGRLQRLGTDDATAGDQWIASALSGYYTGAAAPSLEQARAHVLPAIRAGRAAMNTDDGYGVLSITPPPARFVRSGSLDLAPGSRILLASDGLMRLVDVFARYAAADLLEAAGGERGLAGLVAELRGLEADDTTGARFPRAKRSDDATGVLIGVPG